MKSFFGLLLLLLFSCQVAAKLGESHVLKQDADTDDQRGLMRLQFQGKNPTFKLARCEGDCDDDSDCNSSNLTCFQRDSPYMAVPGCSGGELDGSRSDYCVFRDHLNITGETPPLANENATSTPATNENETPVQVAQAAKPIEWSTNFPLALCQGDCDTDFDCQGGLVCFQRNEKQAVPGCIGAEHDWSRTDYCVPRPASSSNPPGQTRGDLPIAWSTFFPLSRCQGDCDSDIDCQGNLKCFQRSGFMGVPGCVGGENDSSNVDYCIDDNRFSLEPHGNTPPIPIGNGQTAHYVGDNLNFTAHPLGSCQGDCDSHLDCLPGFFCWFRDTNEPMPYCHGANGGIDYCIPESESPGKKLKLYWDNYFWQETYNETFWCMTCTQCDSIPNITADGIEGNCTKPPGDTCEEGNLIWIQKCSDVRKRFDIVKNTGSGDQIRVHGTNLCFSSRKDFGRFLELRPCDNTIQNQLWTPMDNRNKFEIRPWHQRGLSSKEASCVSQLHHPKAEEVISLRECWLNIHYETNYWMEWY